MIVGMPPPELPARYYLHYAHDVFAHLQRYYDSVLNLEDRRFLARFLALSEEAQCLYVRLASRVGRVFRISKLRYEEIGDLERPLAQLGAEGFLRMLTPSDGDWREAALVCFTKPELQSCHPHLPRTLPRPALLDALREEESLLEKLLGCDRLVLQLEAERWQWLLFLFFGNLEENLTRFVLRDLRQVVAEQVAEAGICARYASREEAWDAYRLESLYQEFRHYRDHAGWETERLHGWFRSLELRRERLAASAWPRFDRFCDRLGRMLERAARWENAESLYAQSPVPPCRERRVRVLWRLGKREEALAFAAELRAEPANAEEWQFAESFLRRHCGGERRSLTRARLHQSGRMEIEARHAHYVEEGALAALAAEGWRGAHVENMLWRALFGLLFWDIIYDSRLGGYHQPLQLLPSDFHSAEFLTARRGAFMRRLRLLDRAPLAVAHLKRRFWQKYGRANGLLGWSSETVALLEAFLLRAPGAGVARIMERIATNPAEHLTGFPDLFVWRDDEYRFIEVKSPNDQLSAQQLYWLERFAEAGICCEVLRVFWNDDTVASVIPA